MYHNNASFCFGEKVTWCKISKLMLLIYFFSLSAAGYLPCRGLLYNSLDIAVGVNIRSGSVELLKLRAVILWPSLHIVLKNVESLD